MTANPTINPATIEHDLLHLRTAACSECRAIADKLEKTKYFVVSEYPYEGQGVSEHDTYDEAKAEYDSDRYSSMILEGRIVEGEL